jgi:hypothetical protein
LHSIHASRSGAPRRGAIIEVPKKKGGNRMKSKVIASMMTILFLTLTVIALPRVVAKKAPAVGPHAYTYIISYNVVRAAR